MTQYKTDERVQQKTTSGDDMSSPLLIKDDIKRGPKPGLLKLKGDWKEATKKALERERPLEAWPSPERCRTKKRARTNPDPLGNS